MRLKVLSPGTAKKLTELKLKKCAVSNKLIKQLDQICADEISFLSEFGGSDPQRIIREFVSLLKKDKNNRLESWLAGWLCCEISEGLKNGEPDVFDLLSAIKKEGWLISVLGGFLNLPDANPRNKVSPVVRNLRSSLILRVAEAFFQYTGKPATNSETSNFIKLLGILTKDDTVRLYFGQKNKLVDEYRDAKRIAKQHRA